MDGRDRVRSVKSFGPLRGMREVRRAWRRRGGAAALPERGPERARVPGAAREARALPGGGVVRFARSELRIMVAVGGAVFCGWDGAEPAPSYGLAGEPPEPDPRAELEPDKNGGWRVVSERVTVEVSRNGGVEIRTPGGVALRRDLPPRWWETAAGGPARWSLRSEVPADARVFGLGGRASGLRLRDTAYRLWNGGAATGAGPEEDAPYISMPVQTVVADAGTHLVFHDTTWGGKVTVREGEEGAGSGHDRPGTIEMRMDGGPLRCWVVVGSPARVLSGFAQLTGAPALPPSWALGRHHAGGPPVDERSVRDLAEEGRERSVPLSAVHLGGGAADAGEPFAVDEERFPELPVLAKDLAEDDVRLVRVVAPAVEARPESAVYGSGAAAGVFVKDADGRVVRGADGRAHPDFTDPRVRAWWAEWYEDVAAQGFSGVWHEPEGPAPEGAPAVPWSAPRVLEGRGGDGREAHNVGGLSMARAAYEGLRGCRPAERPFVVSRAGWAGMQRYGGAWCDEVPAGWAGLRAALSLVLGLGLSGVPLAGARTAAAGGDASGPPAPAADGEGELWLRGLQLGAFLPLFLTAGVPRATGRYADAVAAVLRERERLRPYLVSLAHLSRLTGAPMVRPLWWGCPEDRALRDCEDAFLLGDSLLVAPVLERGAACRAVRLPRGRWYDTATERVHEGPGTVTVDAPPARIPVLARAGTVLAVRGADGAVELEAWAPAPGRKGGGLVVRDSGDGWAEPEIERYATGWADGRVGVERWVGDDRVPVTSGLRMRGPVHGTPSGSAP
ncbi:glycoside hydrolase family 31 protein [Streptomyces sp. t39]|uniref:glycoside hydrolase family 31 protein n=1 Tax=Streptomyces sp. t39 TaxID=1828156 RepID=UPI0011CE96B3|nr:TIM-barrel domain-containing protein [Streptomyces sp. t39]TXS51515.1 glycoside hydrolase family 31 protein [Streptomyces sp. t39]